MTKPTCIWTKSIERDTKYRHFFGSLDMVFFVPTNCFLRYTMFIFPYQTYFHTEINKMKSEFLEDYLSDDFE